MKKLLVIDDDENIVDIIKAYFEDNDYQVLTACDAKEGERRLAQKPDIILLDIMMPGMNGIEFCRIVRDSLLCPIVFLSAKTDETNKLLGLTSGGDDYITKPFSVVELHARVEAHLRRESRPKDRNQRIFFDSLWMDYSRCECGVGDQRIDLTKKEYAIVELLTLNAGMVFSQDRVYESVWGYDAEGDARTAVTEHIKRIRKKLGVFGMESKVATVWGIGYKWEK
ncbi:MAG: response regulator transcription factor [Lachnospiraceae bacterium]|jgi:DNA-binding response OmpR family regulator|nr:response regulator transcription factor [Lachnospiraceae bacterium]